MGRDKVGPLIQDGGVIKFANDTLERITGYSKEEGLGRNVLDFISPKDRSMVRERMSFSTRISHEGRPAILVNMLEGRSSRRKGRASGKGSFNRRSSPP